MSGVSLFPDIERCPVRLRTKLVTNKLGRAGLLYHDEKGQTADLSCLKSAASEGFDIALDDGKAQTSG